MLIQFFPNGKGAGDGPVGYLVAERVLANDGNRDLICDADGQLLMVTRDPLPEVLRGDPSRTEALIDASRHQWTYRAGVISFATVDAPSEAQQAEVMDAFEKLAFAGLEGEQYDMLWVRHSHEDRIELHFCTPRLELNTGRSLNIAPPGYQDAFDSLRDLMNQRHGWTDPMELERAKEVRDTIEAPTRVQGRKELHAWILDQVSMGLITDRASMLEALADAGFDLPRVGKAYLTAQDPETGERWRLKGEIFHEDWQADPVEREIERGAGLDTPGIRRLDGIPTGELQERFDSHCERRAAYHRKRYAVLSERDGESFPNPTEFDPSLSNDLAFSDFGADLGLDRLDDGRELFLDARPETVGVNGNWPHPYRPSRSDLVGTGSIQGRTQQLCGSGQVDSLHQDFGAVNESHPNPLGARLARLRRAAGDGLRKLNGRVNRLRSTFDQQDRDTAIWLDRLRQYAHSVSDRVNESLAWFAQRRGELQSAGRSVAENIASSEGRRREAETELRRRYQDKPPSAALLRLVEGDNRPSTTSRQPFLETHGVRRRSISRVVKKQTSYPLPRP